MVSMIALDADKDLQDLVIVLLGFGLAFGTDFLCYILSSSFWNGNVYCIIYCTMSFIIFKGSQFQDCLESKKEKSLNFDLLSSV